MSGTDTLSGPKLYGVEQSSGAQETASAETVNRATEIRLLAERQMGAFLKAMPKAKGEQIITHLNRPELEKITLNRQPQLAKEQTNAQERAGPMNRKCNYRVGPGF